MQILLLQVFFCPHIIIIIGVAAFTITVISVNIIIFVSYQFRFTTRMKETTTKRV